MGMKLGHAKNAPKPFIDNDDLKWITERDEYRRITGFTVTLKKQGQTKKFPVKNMKVLEAFKAAEKFAAALGKGVIKKK